MLDCQICNGFGQVSPRKPDGTADYGQLVYCECQGPNAGKTAWLAHTDEATITGEAREEYATVAHQFVGECPVCHKRIFRTDPTSYGQEMRLVNCTGCGRPWEVAAPGQLRPWPSDPDVRGNHTPGFHHERSKQWWLTRANEIAATEPDMGTRVDALETEVSNIILGGHGGKAHTDARLNHAPRHRG